MSSEKKVALVTGSTSGIGLACAHALAKRGVNIIATGFGDEALINKILSNIREYGVRADYVSADLSKLPEIDALWKEVTRLYPDGIDILINNAGVVFLGRIEEFPDEQWDTSVAVLLSAPFHLTKRCLPGMKKKGWGRIVNTSSTKGFISMPKVAAYSAVKHGVIGLTKGCALENAEFGITCNAVCPGYTDTALTRESATGEKLNQRITAHVAMIPTKKGNTAEQVAELIEFLCLSNASSQITGAAYLIDGGFVAQ